MPQLVKPMLNLLKPMPQVGNNAQVWKPMPQLFLTNATNREYYATTVETNATSGVPMPQVWKPLI
jgi:hypothetical protein